MPPLVSVSLLVVDKHECQASNPSRSEIEKPSQQWETNFEFSEKTLFISFIMNKLRRNLRKGKLEMSCQKQPPRVPSRDLNRT
jgi:hypothetical protein